MSADDESGAILEMQLARCQKEWDDIRAQIDKLKSAVRQTLDHLKSVHPSCDLIAVLAEALGEKL